MKKKVCLWGGADGMQASPEGFSLAMLGCNLEFVPSVPFKRCPSLLSLPEALDMRKAE